MGRNVLLETAMELVADGKGVLAADESDGTIRKRLDVDRRGVDGGQPACLPRDAVHHPGR